MSEPDHQQRQAWLEEALAQYEGPLIRYARRLTGRLEAAQDVVQDTFARLHEQSPADLDGRMAEWLFTVCRNRALDVRKKESRMTTISTAEPITASGSGSIGIHPQPGETIEQSETAQQVLALVAALPQNQQEVVVLRFQNQMSYQQISRITSLSVSNVGYLLHTAIAMLRRRMNENTHQYRDRKGAAQAQGKDAAKEKQNQQ